MSFNHTRTTRTLPSIALALALGTGLAACGGGSSADDADAADAADAAASASEQGAEITVGDPWVRATDGAEDTSVSAAFMTIDNGGGEDVALTGASSPVAGTVEIHEMSTVDGETAMQAVTDGLVVEAGRGKVLEPGGYHVMLMDLGSALSAGDEVELVLEFSDGSSQELTAPVKEFTEEEGHYHAPGTGEHSHRDHDHGDGEGS